MALIARAASGLALAMVAPPGTRTRGAEAASSSPASGACTVRLAFPQAASTAATAPAGDGSFLLPELASTTAHPDSDRMRLLTKRS
jgi:hypothetical protein